MIFVTTGTQIHFDRFIQAIDEIAKSADESFVVQAIKDCYRPKYIQPIDFIPPDEFNKIMVEARLIVSHAGTGSIISSFEYEKPIIIFPRLASLGEHRNDHQMATAMKMNELGYAYVAYDGKQLKDLILAEDLKPLRTGEKKTSEKMLEKILSTL